MTAQELLEQIVKKPSFKPDGVPFFSKFTYVPVSLILDAIGFNNYREHSIKGTNELSNSIEERGLLEPISVAYDSKIGQWDFIDGEGRFWACYQIGADEVPVEIFFDVPEVERLEMKIAANATKAKIDSEDMAIFSKKLHRLLREYEGLDEVVIQEAARQMNSSSEISFKEFGKIIGRSSSVVSDYFVFVNMDDKVVQWVLDNRNKHYFSRAVKAGRLITDSARQRTFFDKIIAYEKNSDVKRSEGEKAPFRLDSVSFNKALDEELNLIKLNETFVMSNMKGNDKLSARDLFAYIRTARHYIDSFSTFIDYYSAILEGVGNYRFDSPDETIDSFLVNIKRLFWDKLSQADVSVRTKVQAYLEHPVKKSFREKIFERAQRKRTSASAYSVGESINRIHAIGNDIEWIPINQIVLNPNQPRTYYKPEKLNALEKNISKIGQIKAGLVRPLRFEDGVQIYQMIYGQSRFQSVVNAEVSHYKCFVRNDLTDLEIAILQCMEDLHEQDTPFERAKIISKQFQLVKLHAEMNGESYSREDFVRDFSELGTKQTLDYALTFMETSPIVQSMVNLNLIGYSSAAQIDSLPDQQKFEVLYATMADKKNSVELTKLIENAKARVNQVDMFSSKGLNETISYVAIYDVFQANSLAPFMHLSFSFSKDVTAYRKNIISNTDLFLQLAKLYQSVEKLEQKIIQSR
jgi:ParB-like chromosome segregation protein Spo0J